MSEIDKLAWLYIENKQVLLARSKGKEVYYIPGGKREPGETDQEALCREINEELSVSLVLSTIKPYGAFTAQAEGKPLGQQVRVTCYFAQFSGKLQASAEIEEIAWLKYEDYSKCSRVTQIVMDKLKIEGLIG